MRPAGWEKRQRLALAPWWTRAFAWVTADCGCLMSDNVQAITLGPDPMGELRGQYTDALSNVRLLQARGFASPADFVASKFEEIPVALARRGDIGVVGKRPHAPLVVVMGPILLGCGERGLETLPRAELTRAFLVG